MLCLSYYFSEKTICYNFLLYQLMFIIIKICVYYINCVFIITSEANANGKTMYYYAGKKYRVVQSLWCDLEEKCLGNSKIFFDGVFLSIYSHLLKKLELSELNRKKKSWKWLVPKKSPYQKRYIFFCSFSISVAR